MRVPDGGPGYTVSTHMLTSAARYLNEQAQSLYNVRNSFNDACYPAETAFGSGSAGKAFNLFVDEWYKAFGVQAGTMESAAEATEKCAVVYDHAERIVLRAVPTTPNSPPPGQGTPQSPGG